MNSASAYTEDSTQAFVFMQTRPPLLIRSLFSARTLFLLHLVACISSCGVFKIIYRIRLDPYDIS